MSLHVTGRHRHPGSRCGGSGPQAHFLATFPGAAVSPDMSLLYHSGTSLEPGHSRGPQAPPPALSPVGGAGRGLGWGEERVIHWEDTVKKEVVGGVPGWLSRIGLLVLLQVLNSQA